MMNDQKLDSSFGITENTIQGNGTKIKNTALAFGNLQTAMFTWDNGSKAKSTDMARI
jgi:hypothetical protein